MSIPVIVTGDNVALQVTLKKNGSTFLINSGATVEASLIGNAHEEVFVAAVAQSSGTSGADWANSVVVVIFSPTDTENVTHKGEAVLEIQVDDSGKTTFFADLEIAQGTIA